MAVLQVTASSITTRSLASFEGLRSSTVRLSSVGSSSRLSKRSYKGLVVKAATVVAPKDEFSEVEEFCYDLTKETGTIQGHKQTKKDYTERSSSIGERVTIADKKLNVKYSKNITDKKSSGDFYNASNRLRKGDLIDSGSRGKRKIAISTRSRFHQLSEELELDEDTDDDLFSDDEFSEVEDFGYDLTKETGTTQGHKQTKKGYTGRSSSIGERVTTADKMLTMKNGKNITDKKSSGDVYNASNRLLKGGPIDSGSRGKLKTAICTRSRFHQLSEELELDEKWFPLFEYLSTFGLKESHFIQIYERHMSSLQINVTSAQERLEFLLSVGVKHRDIRKIILRQPQILEYTVENNLKSHVAFLVDLGIPHSRIGHIISAAPSLFSYSVEHSLKPTVRYLVEEVGIKTSDVSKVVQLSPQILVQRLDSSWSTRFGFLSKELGAPRDSIVKMVRKHPQLLHYSIEDGILPRINFLRSIGMRNSEVLKVLTGLTQVLSLSLEDNLKPKYLYLVNDLKNEVQSLTKYPTYLSLSLNQRIRPRHRFLVSLKRAPKGPFPLSSFVPTDECFCQRWAKTSLDKYLTFRQNLLLKEFAKKYERR